MTKLNIVATQVILNIWDCDPKIMSDRAWLRKYSSQAVLLAGATSLNISWQDLHPGNMYSSIIEGGHVRIMTYPDKKFFVLDAYVTDEKINLLALIEPFINCFRTLDYSTRFISHTIPSNSTPSSSSSEECS